MGQCVSIVPGKAAPICRVCKAQAPLPWNKLDPTERASWVWEGDTAMCRKCVVVGRLDQIQFEKDRKRYKAAKEEMYPKVTEGIKPSLKRLNSKEQWDNSSSFYSDWRPPSTLKRLLSAIRLAQAEDPKQFMGMQRKGTGFVPASTPSAMPGNGVPGSSVSGSPNPPGHGVGVGVGVQGADATEAADLTAAELERQREEERLANSQRQLAALEEECGLEAVEELSMNMSGLPSTVRSSLPTMDEGAEEQEEEEEACSGEVGAGGGGGIGGPAAGTAASQLQSRSKLLQGSGTSRQLQSQLAALLGGYPEGDREQATAWEELLNGSVRGGAPAAMREAEQQMEAAGPAELQPSPPAGQALHPARHAPSPTEVDRAPAPDFSRRNMARLGGDGVAGVLGGPELPHDAEARHDGGHKRAATSGGAAFMSALHGIRAGPSDGQRAHQALQREQLKRDLEAQMQAKKEAETASKAALAALEEREETELRAYWAAQAAAASKVASPGVQGGAGGTAGPASSRQQQQQRQQVQPDGELATQRKGRAGTAGRSLDEQLGSRGGPGQAGLGPEPLRAAAGAARRGEALVQPGIAVFLPPDKAAERQASLRANRAAHTVSFDEPDLSAAAAFGGGGSRRLPPPATAPASTAMLAAQQAQVQQQQAVLAQAQAAAYFAAASAGGGGGIAPFYHYGACPPPGMPFMLGPPATSAGVEAGSPSCGQHPFGPPPTGSSSSSNELQVLCLLRDLQLEQQRMRQQLAQQLDAVGRLGGDAAAARSERDRARVDLERVQRMLAQRQGAEAGAGRLASEQDMGGVTTHVLPLAARQIPSRLGTPAHCHSTCTADCQAEAAQQLPARYRQPAAEPWQQQAVAAAAAQKGQRGARGAGRAGAKQVAGAGRDKQQLAAKPGKGWKM
ncbi:hypothetical protein ACK3TF_002941 [Chlorella vulgaris]